MPKKKILVLCPSPRNTNPAQRLKYEQYFEGLEKEGYSITISSFQTQRFWDVIYKEGKLFEKVFWTLFGYLRRIRDLFRIPFYDGIYVFLWITPLGPPLMERLVCFLNKKIVYDIDDMIFLGDTSESNKLIAPLKGRNKPLVLMAKASHVIVCTPKLEEIARNYNENVTDISSTFNTDRFKPVAAYRKNEVTAIGWTGTHSTLKFLALLKDVLKEVASKRKIKLVLIADRPMDIEGVEVEFIKWTEEKEIEDLHKIEIGLYPLPTEDWVLGKSGLKALNYMSNAIPAIATAIGANYRVIEDGVSGYLVKTHEEWVEAIIRLIDDVELRKRIGEAGRKRVEEHFSLKVNFQKYLDIFNENYK